MVNNMAVAGVRNFVLLGHTQSGKTALCDALLFKLGLNDRLGSVDDGSSMADFTDEEKKRKITIYSKTFTGDFAPKGRAGARMVFSDTPGYDDFVGQILCACRAADSAIIVVDATAGIQVGTAGAWKRCRTLGMPCGVVVTGIDRENTDFNKVVEQIRAVWGARCAPVGFHMPGDGQIVDLIAGAGDGSGAELAGKYKGELAELAAESNDVLLEKYLAGEQLMGDELIGGLRAGMRAGSFVPVFPAAPAEDIGVAELLEGIARLFPIPSEREPKDAAGAPIQTNPDAPFVGLVWKSVTDAYAGKLAFVRVLGGTLKEGFEALNANKGHKERIGSMLAICGGKKPAPVSEAVAGDVVALPKMKNTGLNDVLCAPGLKVELAPIVFPNPVVSFAAVAKERADEDKIGIALSRVAEDDPTLTVERRADTNEIVISGMGDVHIDVAQELMKKRSNVDVTFSTPKVPYRETVSATAEGHYKHKKQSGGRGQYGEVYARVAPKGPDEEWFDDAVVGGVIPRNFIPACEKGFAEALTKGAVAGYPVVNVKVTVYDGSYHDVDSSEIAFKIAAGRAFREAMSKARPVLLEPIMKVKVMISDQHMGEISGDMNHRRGRILGVDVEDGMQVITAEVPQSEMFRYSSELRSMTGGHGSFEMSFSRYDTVPSAIAQKIVAAAGKSDDEED